MLQIQTELSMPPYTPPKDGQCGWYGDRSPSGYARAIMVCWCESRRAWLDMYGLPIPQLPVFDCEAKAIKDVRKRYPGVKS